MTPGVSNLLTSDGTFANGQGRFVGALSQTTASFTWNDEVDVTIGSTTTEAWHIQLQHALAVEEDQEYTICYDAKADSARTISVNIDQGGTPDYESVIPAGGYSSSLGTSYSSFSHTFVSRTSDSSARLTFNLGLEAVSVQLDNIGVYEGGQCGDPSAVPSGPEGSGSDNIVGTPPITTEGNQILFGGQQGSVAGVSLFWSQWPEGSPYYTAETVARLKSEWDAKLVRAAMGVDAMGGYMDDPEGNLSRVRTVVEAATQNDMYVIIDWHTHNAEEPAIQTRAIAFFEQMASDYGDRDNVIYEIYNEPDCPSGVALCSWDNKTSWAEIKAYAETVIAAIRAIDEDNLIIVGTPYYSQFVDEASEDPINDVNVAYTLHFYAGSEAHQGVLRNRAYTAIQNGIPLFVTEWGTSEADGGTQNPGFIDLEQSAVWLELLYDNNISHANWSMTNKAEASAILNPGTGSSWTESDLTPSGQWIKEQIQNW